MAKAWQNMGVVGAETKYPPALKTDAQNWVAAVGAATLGDVGFLRGVILHHYHGSQANRHYSMRMRILLEGGFDPARDTEHNADGVWVWRNDPSACVRTRGRACACVRVRADQACDARAAIGRVPVLDEGRELHDLVVGCGMCVRCQSLPCRGRRCFCSLSANLVI
jgi:hypothetical protein